MDVVLNIHFAVISRLLMEVLLIWFDTAHTY